jgi:hypothetical protein
MKPGKCRAATDVNSRTTGRVWAVPPSPLLSSVARAAPRIPFLPAMSTQPKGKKRDEQALPPTPEGGLKPVQIQRRRVWRACESCRRVRFRDPAHARPGD